jgi:Beta-propeller repeat
LRTGGEDAWLTKLGPGGRVHWKRQLRTSETDKATSVATDVDGNVYVAGWTTGSLGGPISGIADAWLAKYDDAGKMLWIRQFNGLPGWYYTAVEVTNRPRRQRLYRGEFFRRHTRLDSRLG